MAKRKKEIRPDLKAKPGTAFTFLLVGNIPSKKNRVRFGSNGVYHDKNFTKWHKAAVAQITPHVPAGGWIASSKLVQISFTFESLRQKDLTNAAESIMDLLVDVGILKDDNFKVVPLLSLAANYIKGMSETKIEIVI